MFRQIFFIAFLIIAFSGSTGCSKKLDADEAVLFELKKAGSDLSKPCQIDFYLYFPTQAAAEGVAAHIRHNGFQAETKQAAKGTDWLCLATKTMTPHLPEIRRICSDFEHLANSEGGEYDGWETSLD